MKISVIGTGYVGLITGACFAELGNEVVCVDVIKEKVDRINRGEAPIHEMGLEELLQEHVGKNLRATTDLESAVLGSDITFICVGTPDSPEGGIDLKYVKSAAESVGKSLKKKEGYHVVVDKSTVVPGTTDSFIKPILEEESGKKAGRDFGVAMNPEFLREGLAVEDFMRPDRVVVGSMDKKSGDKVEELYKSFDGPILRTDLRTAEMIKYAANAFLATKISFINEMANICERSGTDVVDVAKGIGLDRRISPKFLNAGVGYGGSCLKGDSLIHTPEGMKPIKSIKVGDKVYGHDGFSHKVTKTFTRRVNEDLIQVVPRGLPAFELTGNHPVYGVRANRKIYGKGENKGKLINNKVRDWTPQWIRAEELERGDYLVFPIFKDNKNRASAISLGKYGAKEPTLIRPMPERIGLTGDLMRLFGYYLAEGSTDQKRVTLSFSRKDEELRQDSIRVVKKVFGLDLREHGNKDTMASLRIGSVVVKRLIEDMCGKLSNKKQINSILMVQPLGLQAQMIKGMWKGDGSKSGGVWTWATTSRQLFNQMKILLLKQGIIATYSIHKPWVSKSGLRHREAYFVRISNKKSISRMNKLMTDAPERRDNKYHKTSWIRSNYLYYPIHKINRVPYSGRVYNLEIDTVHSYLCEGATLHNCFPKDVKAIARIGMKGGYEPLLLDAVMEINERQAKHAVNILKDRLGNIKGKRIAIVGLAFKPGTDDLREAPSLKIIEHLLMEGASISACDPAAVENAKEILGDKISFSEDLEECLKGADAAVIVTEWPEYVVKPEVFKRSMKGNVVIDGRRILDPLKAKSAGLDYFGIGYGK